MFMGPEKWGDPLPTQKESVAKINKYLKKKVEANKLKENKEQPVEKPLKMPQFIDNGHCLAVAKALLNLILLMDHSSSADMMLLSFKVSCFFLDKNSVINLSVSGYF